MDSQIAVTFGRTDNSREMTRFSVQPVLTITLTIQYCVLCIK